MNHPKNEWRLEQQRVDRVIREIDRRLTLLNREASGVKSDIVDIRRNFWEDVRVNFSNDVEIHETVASINQQARVLSERERRHQSVQKQIDTLKKLKYSPYFGRIDFTENGEEKEQIYLGIASLIDEQNDEFLIYDWRAPISSLYYDYPPGPARYRTPAGTIEGVIHLKRQFLIRNGLIESLFDTGITIGDELLKEVLGKQSDSQMKSIVATIQKDQNRIIRNEHSRLVVVQGAAGSGKTSAALQRIAYLLYRYRKTLRAENILLFSPNPMFNRYVSTVLPELGEENMQQTTFQELLERRLGKTLALEDPFSQIEYTLTAINEPGYEARMEGIRYKASRKFMELLDRYFSFLEHGKLKFRDIPFRNGTIIPADEIQQHFASLDPSIPLTNRISLLTQRLVAELKQLAKKEEKKTWVEDEIQWLDKSDYIRADQQLLKEKHFTDETFDDTEREQKLLARIVVQKQIKRSIQFVKHLRYLDSLALYRQLFADPDFAGNELGIENLPEQWPAICRQTVAKLDQRKLFYEDATPYLLLKTRLEGIRTNTSIRHVFIDEAQDYSPFQFSFIKRIYPRCKMTILGDFNQAVFAHVPVNNNLNMLSSLYGSEQTEMFELRRSYRSTCPIIRFTRHLVENKDAIEPFERPGEKPTVTEVSKRADLHEQLMGRIDVLKKAGYKTIAVICKTARESRMACEALEKKAPFPVQQIRKETVQYQPGVLVIPVYLAKGIEFDAVIIYDASEKQYSRKNERKLLYTACTRAMHALHIYCLGRMSPFIATAPKDTYMKDNR
ncbi:RNA polymerase recycling motor HelD [Thermoactinomyces mirandus]|uniref:ATP-binding domain-containing protein n=1 Tax=Thermoactinomyces mirandus TaxID=2756294 RepID=A0A7W2AR84_9BACL|nr:RNA polymerase recycling motor HelD [Thermoactinomyces mirandus]MBA4601310.1 ATP-binding domain-containing protein [Thermoactinomyces mirandus]